MNSIYDDLITEYQKETQEYIYNNMYDIADILLIEIRKYIKKYHIGYYELYFEWLNNGYKFKQSIGKKKREKIVEINETIKQMITNNKFKSTKLI
jgi:hypothetical protein